MRATIAALMLGLTVAGADAGTTVVDLGGRDGGAVLLWLTDVGEGDRAEIAELRVRA